MTLRRTALLAAQAFLALSGCHVSRGENNGGVPGDSQSSQTFQGISATETLHFVGTEPFWGGDVRGTVLRYNTPEISAGTQVDVRRFAGRNGLGLSGKLGDKAFDMTVTPGSCSDGMSDRRFPFLVTLKLGEEVRSGCGWTDTQRYTEGKPKR
jgi:uncharacterized membrane protein